jgi:hypothetical protein
MASSPPLAAASPTMVPVIMNTPTTPVVPLGYTPQDQQLPPNQQNSIVLPPVAPTTEQKTAPTSNAIASENVDACCSSSVAIGFLALGLIMFLIFVTIAGALGQSNTAFCEGYVSLSIGTFHLLILTICLDRQWRLSPKYQFSGHVRARYFSSSVSMPNFFS